MEKKEEMLRKRSLVSRIKEGGKRLLSLVLSLSMVACGLPSIPAWAATAEPQETIITMETEDTENEGINEDDDVQEFTLTLDDLMESLREAVTEGNPIKETALKFTGAAEDDYDELFYWTDVYELFPEVEDDRDGHLTLRIFARMTGEQELDSFVIDGKEEIIFLLLNSKDEEQTARIYIDGYDTGKIVVAPRDEVILEKDDVEDIEEADSEPVTEEAAEETAAAAAPVVSGGAGGGTGASGVDSDAAIIPSDDAGIPVIEPFDDGSESTDAGYESGYSDEDTSGAYDSGSNEGSSSYEGGTSDTGYGSDQGDITPDAGSSAQDDGSDSDTGDNSQGSDSGYEGGSSDSGSSDSGYSDTGSSDSGDSDAGSSDSGSSNSGNAGSGNSGSESSDSGSSSAGSSNSGSSSSGSSDSGNGSDSGSSGSGSSDSGSSSGSGSSDSGSSSSGSSDSGSSSGSGSSDSGSSGSGSSDSSSSMASVSSHSVGLLATSLPEIEDEAEEDTEDPEDAEVEIYIDPDEDEAVVYISADSEVTLEIEDSSIEVASSSDAKEKDDDFSTTSGMTELEGETYEAVLVNKRRSAVAFVTTLEDLGIENEIEIEVDLEDVVYRAEDDGIAVTVTAPAGALPEEAELSVTRYAADSDEFKEAAKALGFIGTVENMAAFDISFMVDGEEVEPEKEVEVVIDASEIIPEDVDLSTVEVSHLEENRRGRIMPVAVANEKKGNIDKGSALARFFVDSFSNFTITWTPTSGDVTTVTVYVYNQNGLGIYDAETDFIVTGNTITISDLVRDHASTGIEGSYHFEYATVQYLSTTGVGSGGTVTTIGSSTDSVTQVTWNGTSYVVTTGTGTTTVTKSTSTATEFYINLYFAVPTVEIELVSADTTTGNVTLTADAEHFQNSNITYEWSLAEGDDEYASINENSSSATVTWNSDDPSGTTVTVIVTATSADGETAVDTYELIYGMEQVIYTVYYPGGTNGSYIAVGEGADVALKDAEGHVVAEGTTDASGQVTLWVVSGETYTLEASYTVSSTSSGSGPGPGTTTNTHYTHEDTSYAYNQGESTVIYLETTNSNYYEHVDVKLSIADPAEEGYTDILAMVDYVRIYNEEGTEIYTSSQMVHNSGTNDYNVIFTNADGNESHSIIFFDSYTIEIAYEVTYYYTDENGDVVSYTETYVATINNNTTYVEGEYYSYSGTNAYQLYNVLNGTNYTEDEFNSLVASGSLPGYDPNGIDIGGRTFYEVAAALCDSMGETGMAGLDLALGVNSLIRVSSTTWNFEIQKTLKNAEMTADEFRFPLFIADVDESGVWYINASDASDNSFYKYVTNNAAELEEDSSVDVADGSFAFDVTSTQANVTNSYYFVLFEQADTAEDSNIIYDSKVYGIKVDVTLNSSTDLTDVTITATPYILTATESSEPEEGYRYYEAEQITVDEDEDGHLIFEFENTYALAEAEIQVQKVLEGRDWKTEDSFTFTISADEGTPVPDNTELTITSDDAEEFTKAFDSISYTEAGTYTYTITETNGDIDGIEYDQNSVKVTVTVTSDDETGDLTASVKYGDDDEATAAVFINTYSAEPTSVQFTGTKYITNSTSTEKVFSFQLYQVDDDTFDIDGKTETQTKSTVGTITSDGQTVKFDAIEYYEAGTYYYVIQEKALEAAEGWTIDSKVYNITVKVSDNGLGQLVATVTVNETEVSGTEDVYGGFDFSNAYAAEGEVTLGVVKSISGVSSTDKEFEFTLYESDENFTAGNSIETITTDGTIDYSTELNFTAIPYTEAGPYYYVIKETGTAPDGWTLDTKEYHVTVTVTDKGNGTLTTSASYALEEDDEGTESRNAANFTNKYKAEGKLSLTGTKTLLGRDTLEADSFTFTMTDSTGTSVGDATMYADGTITFPTLTYNETNISGEYTYYIAETNTEDPTIIYDDAVYTVVVKVADNSDGTLDITHTITKSDEGDYNVVHFDNYLKGSLVITKTFTGLTEDQIAELSDFTITVTNSSDVTVATLTLNEADDGSAYTWTVDDLWADTYTITETGYSLDGYEVVAKSGEVEVTDGSDVSVNDKLEWGSKDTVEFTNDYTEVGSITITKYVVAEEDIQGAHADTEYTVTITASEDVDYRWVEVTSSIGREITPAAGDDGKSLTFTIMEDETITVTGLPAGEYSVEEQGSDAMTSDHCVPSYRVGDKDTEVAPTITVASGEENIVAVEIDNEYPIATYVAVEKKYNRDTYPEEGFTFTIEALSCDLEADDVTLIAEDMPMPDSNTVTITESGQTGYFGYITYEHLGTYYYKITETAGTEENVDYDTSVHYIKVVVESTKESHVEITDEYEAKAEKETEAYKDLDYEEAGIVTAEFTNTAYDKLTLEKEVSGDAGDTTEYTFEITLTKDGKGYDGDIEVADEGDAEPTGLLSRVSNWFSGVVRMFSDDGDNGEAEGTITFTDGKGTVIVTAGEKVTLLIPSGYECTITEKTTGSDTTTIYIDDDEEKTVQFKGTTTQATAELGTISDSTYVTFVNSYRSYYPIEELIVVDENEDDYDSWVEREAVNEYNRIEIEMTTKLPVVTEHDLTTGDFTMLFHNELVSHLMLDDHEAVDLHIRIHGEPIDPKYYQVEILTNDVWTINDYMEESVSPVSTLGITPLSAIYDLPIDDNDNCTFHVNVNLTDLYKDKVINIDDITNGDTEITVFFYVDLEGMNLNSSYSSTIWYNVFDGEELLYTSNKDVVEVYTYEIDISKTSTSNNAPLAGATFGIYYDEVCTKPVSRYGENYEVTSGDDGMATFWGLADGTYYVKELEAPSGYILEDDPIEVELGGEGMDGYGFGLSVGNTPGSGRSRNNNGGGGSGSSRGGSTAGSDGGPGTSGGSSGEGESWDLLPLPSTGQGRTMLFGAIAFAVSAMALIVLLWYRRRERRN